MPGPEYEALLRRRRIWGVPPDVVEHLAAMCQREQTDLRTHVAELETRLARVTAQRDESSRNAATLEERTARLEQEKTTVVDGPEIMREEAVRFVVEAYAEAHAIREQAQQAIAEAEATSRDEVAAMRQALVEERQRHEAELAALREQRLKAVAELEALAGSLLNVGRAIVPTTSSAPTAPATPLAASSTPTTPEEADASRPPAADGDDAGKAPTEDALLAKALDELEGILSANRKAGG